MADDVKFNINGKLEIVWSDGYYKSDIQDLTDQYIAISIPIKDGQYIPLRQGEQLEVLYFYNKEEMYKFYTVVVGRKVDKVPVILLEFPKELIKIQRRKFVRVPIVCAIDLSKIENGNIDSDVKKLVEKNQALIKAVMVDLSGGGMRIKIKNELKLDDSIIAYIPLDSGEVAIKGEVVRVEKDEEKRYVCGINFVDLEEKVQDKIIRYIFQIMRNQRRKV